MSPLNNTPTYDEEKPGVWARTFRMNGERSVEMVRFPWQEWGHPGLAHRSFRCDRAGEDPPIGEPAIDVEPSPTRASRYRHALVWGLSCAKKCVLEVGFPMRVPLRVRNANEPEDFQHEWWLKGNDPKPGHPISAVEEFPCAFPMSDQAAHYIRRSVGISGSHKKYDIHLYTNPGPLAGNMQWSEEEYNWDTHGDSFDHYYRAYFERKCTRILVYKNMTHNTVGFVRYSGLPANPYGVGMTALGYDYIGRAGRNTKFGVSPPEARRGGDRRFQPWGWVNGEGFGGYQPEYDRYYFSSSPSLPSPLLGPEDEQSISGEDVSTISPDRLFQGMDYGGREWSSGEWDTGDRWANLAGSPFDIIVEANFWRYRLFKNTKIPDTDPQEWDRVIHRDWTYAGAYGRMFIIY